MRYRPILLIDDGEECELVGDALQLQNIQNKRLCFSNGREAIDELGNLLRELCSNWQRCRHPNS